MEGMTTPTLDAIGAALATVEDPEIHKPITELGMVESVDVSESGHVAVTILLTIAGCPLKAKLTEDTTKAVMAVDGVTGVQVNLGVMNDEQRKNLREQLKGSSPEREIPFAKPGSMTRVYAVASGKGGVGKSSVTTNLAAALAEQGLKVGVVDADIYGFSVPRMLGVAHRPTQVDDMILPPEAHDVKVISIGMFVPGNQPVVWRGPMLHRALQQFLGDVRAVAVGGVEEGDAELVRGAHVPLAVGHKGDLRAARAARAALRARMDHQFAFLDTQFGRDFTARIR